MNLTNLFRPDGQVAIGTGGGACIGRAMWRYILLRAASGRDLTAI